MNLHCFKNLFKNWEILMIFYCINILTNKRILLINKNRS